ncbi:TrmB family transcriptional regulator [Caviibacter abscessus]|uniref:TrmB family transcriptional regulator n=1 Tax=Caviibacter abscessus TaxID=1766719 RepID=UPI00082E1122|nr:helix-turn-helix domain-containing protein [Caviibacter abscessus]
MDVIEKLKKIGFSLAEAQIYMELLKNPGLNGTQISKVTQLPRTTAYQALDSLSSKGIINLIPTQTDKRNYIPVNPKDIINDIKKEYENILANIGLELEMIYKPSNFFEVYNINGRLNLIYKMQDMISGAKSNIVVVGLTELDLLPKTQINMQIEDSDNEFIVLVDDSEILIGNINDNYANGIYTKNMYVVSQYLRRRNDK